MLHKSQFLTVVLLGLLATPSHAQQQAALCAGPEYRQFDFWIGEWEVFNPAGEKVGESRIERALNGCALHENWRSGTSSFAGSSYNMHDRLRDVWHQTWVDNSGQLLRLEGGLNTEGDMVLRGERPKAKGEGRVIDRITWSANDDGSVRQLWEQSANAGESWKVVFDGLYRRKQGS